MQGNYRGRPPEGPPKRSLLSAEASGPRERRNMTIFPLMNLLTEREQLYVTRMRTNFERSGIPAPWLTDQSIERWIVELPDEERRRVIQRVKHRSAQVRYLWHDHGKRFTKRWEYRTRSHAQRLNAAANQRNRDRHR